MENIPGVMVYASDFSEGVPDVSGDIGWYIDENLINRQGRVDRNTYLQGKNFYRINLIKEVKNEAE